MGGGQKDAARQARAQAIDARKTTQSANEEAGRNRQQAERGSSGKTRSGSRGGRTLLMGMLSERLKSKIGAA